MKTSLLITLSLTTACAFIGSYFINLTADNIEQYSTKPKQYDIFEISEESIYLSNNDKSNLKILIESIIKKVK